MTSIGGTLDQTTPRERILKNIRDALIEAKVETPGGVDLDSNIYLPNQGSLDVVFAERFIANGGAFLYCEGAKDALKTFVELVESRSWAGRIFCKDPVVEELLDFAGIVYGNRPTDAVLKNVVFCNCRYLIAQDGSILWDSSSMGRRAMAQADEVVFVASVEQVMPDFRSVVRLMKEKKGNLPSMLSRWSGKAVFEDIDGTEISGVGPKEVFLVLIDNN